MTSTLDLGDDLNRIIELARRENQCGVAVRAIMAKAKLFGFLDHKKETRTGLLDDLDFDQLRLIHDLVATTMASGEQPEHSDSDENVH